MKGWWLFILSGCLSEVSHLPAGTPARLEKEFKIAFSSDRKIEDITTLLQKKIFFSVVHSSNLKLLQFEAPKMLNNNYYLSGRLEPFIFLDFYFDTNDNLLAKNNSIYRLRYRWKDLKDFEGFSKTFLSQYYPIRVEVQAKTNIIQAKNELTSALESRFEFRDDSTPFSKDFPAPKAPWPLKDYLLIAQKGEYLNYNLLPFIEIQNILGLKPYIQPKYIVKTARRRLHLNIESPWGSGPNPNQVFIITIDHFQFKNFENIPSTYVDDFVGNFYEIEVEFERNTSTLLDVDITEYATNIKRLFSRDHNKIRKIIIEFLQEIGAVGVGQAMSKSMRARSFIKENGPLK